MHRIGNPPRMNGPHTTGITIHWASQYDVISKMFGMGTNSRSSRKVIELANVKPGDIVLDAACGTGNLTLTAQSLAMPGGKVYGIDAAPK